MSCYLDDTLSRTSIKYSLLTSEKKPNFSVAVYNFHIFKFLNIFAYILEILERFAYRYAFISLQGQCI